MPTPSTEELQRRGLARLEQLTEQDTVIGVDEVGFGAWAGPVTVCAVVVPALWRHGDVKDSKVLSPSARQRLVATVLKPPAVLFSSIVCATSGQIDKVGLGRSRDALVVRAVKECREHYPSAVIVMDGNQLPAGVPANAVCMPKADSLVTAVSAASVLAKVFRDTIMLELSELYPHYGFRTNVGYGGNIEHARGLEEHGVCPIHRVSYRNLRVYVRK